MGGLAHRGLKIATEGHYRRPDVYSSRPEDCYRWPTGYSSRDQGILPPARHLLLAARGLLRPAHRLLSPEYRSPGRGGSFRLPDA